MLRHFLNQELDPSLLTKGFLGGLDGKESSCNAGNSGLILGRKDSLEKGMANHSKYSYLEISIDRGAWWTMVYGLAKSWIQLSGYHLHLPY